MSLGRIAGGRADGVAFVGLAAVLALAPLPDGRESMPVAGAFALALSLLLLVLGTAGGTRRAPLLGALTLLSLLGSGFAAATAVAGIRHPGEVEAGLVRPVVLGGIFLLALIVSAEAGRAARLLRLIVGFAAGYAAHGLIVGVAGWTDVVAAYRAAAAGHLGGPHLSPHAFAVFAGLGLLAATALLLDSAREAGTRADRWAWAGFAAFFLACLFAAGSGAPTAAVALAGIVLVGLAGAPVPGKRLALGLTGLLVIVSIGRLGPLEARFPTPGAALALLLPLTALLPGLACAFAARASGERSARLALGPAAAALMAAAAVLGGGRPAAAAGAYGAAILGIACAEALGSRGLARLARTMP